MFQERTDYLPAPDNWGQWAPMLKDVALWRPVIQCICQENELGPVEEIEGGYAGTCAVFIVDRQTVIKIFPPFLPDDFLREVEAYELVGARLDPYMPELLAYGSYPDQIDWHYLAITYLPGEPIREVRSLMTPEDKLAAARELGWTIRRLHQTPLEKAEVLVPKSEEWLAFLGRRRKECLLELKDNTNLPLEVLREVARFLTPGQLVPSRDFQLKLLNGDFTEDHLLLVYRLGEWRMSGLIDWADALVGVSEYEWVALWFGLCSQEVEMFREVLATYDPEIRLDNPFRRRMMAYTFIHRFGPTIIGDMLRKPGAPAVRSLVDLQTWLWPPMLSI